MSTKSGSALNYEKQTVPMLKAECKRRNLEVTGLKETLVSRLYSHDDLLRQEQNLPLQ